MNLFKHETSGRDSGLILLSPLEDIRDSNGLAKVIANQTMPGDFSVLYKAIWQSVAEADLGENTSYEQMDSVWLLCDWWNSVAPLNMRLAGVFRLYVWDQSMQIFVPLADEPVWRPETISDWPSYSVFQTENIAVVVRFERGKAFNTVDDLKGFTQTYFADGSPADRISTYFADGSSADRVNLDLDEMDEAYYSFQALIAMSTILAKRGIQKL